MFQGLRPNSIFYVLDKGENPSLKIGQVVSVSNPQPKFPTYTSRKILLRELLKISLKTDNVLKFALIYLQVCLFCRIFALLKR